MLGRTSAAGFVPLFMGKTDPAQRSYQADIDPSLVASVHELRYRDAHGQEVLLAAVLVECDMLECGTPVVPWSSPVACESVAETVPSVAAPVGRAYPRACGAGRPARLRQAPPPPPPRSWV